MSDDRKEGGLLQAVVTDAAALLALGTAVLYLIGWSFNSGYNDRFGLDSNLFNMGVPETIVTAFRVLVAFGLRSLLLLGTLLGLLAIAIVIDFYRDSKVIKGFHNFFNSGVSSTTGTPERFWIFTRSIAVLLVTFFILGTICIITIDIGRNAAEDVATGTTGSFLSGQHPHLRVYPTDSAASVPHDVVLVRGSAEYLAVMDSTQTIIVYPRDQIRLIVYTEVHR